MKNDDLIAFLQPVPSCFQEVEWQDATGAVQDIGSQGGKFVLRTDLPAGLYRGEILLRKGTFDMETAMMEMVRAPDGQRVLMGPMDLDHVRNVMAMPMALVTVNGHFCGGLWFAMPGAEKIAAGQLAADFGFRHGGGPLELELVISEKDQKRVSWDDVQFLALRTDDRRVLEWKPGASQRPRFFVAGLGRAELARKLREHPGFEEALRSLDPPVEEWRLHHGPNGGMFDLACLIGYAMEDAEILAKARRALLTLCEASTWSGRPDPLLMGGDNDRGVGFNLAIAGIGWEFLQDILTAQERATVQAKAGEYIGKMFDFTVLQRAYMGYPSPDPHSLGTWWGVGIACMAFYDELPIAREALPFFHALMVDSLGKFPSTGKAPWATFFPLWAARYFAAAIEFGGRIPEVDESPFLDHLAGALLTCFRSPNMQEMQRGLRTVEHRMLTAFLNAFHPTPPVTSIHAAFVAEELRQAGDVRWGMFDLLYGPVETTEPASFPETPLLGRDTGGIIATVGPQRINVQIYGGNQAGRRNSFRLQPHNREYPRSLGDFTLSVDGDPVLIMLQGSYGLFSAQRNALCFEEGGVEGEGQYLNGDIPPERSSFIRRFCLNDRFLYADVNLTPTLQAKLNVRFAQRIFLLDRLTGIILVRDIWASSGPLKVGTHLQCAGRITDEGEGLFQLTGGQANTLAGIKYGDMGMTDDERGKIHARVLEVSAPWRVQIGEPTWIPAYIYGINGSAGQKFEDARYPRLQRWRLELTERVTGGHIFFALSAGKEDLSLRNNQVDLPEGATYHLGKSAAGQNWNCDAEGVAHDTQTGQVMALGVTRWSSGKREILFQTPVDICYDTQKSSGVIHSPMVNPVDAVVGFKIEAPVKIANHLCSLYPIEIHFYGTES